MEKGDRQIDEHDEDRTRAWKRLASRREADMPAAPIHMHQPLL